MNYWITTFQNIIKAEIEKNNFTSRQSLNDMWGVSKDIMHRLYNDLVKTYIPIESSGPIENGLNVSPGWLDRLWTICHNQSTTLDEVIKFLNDSGYPATQENFESGKWAGQREVSGEGALTLPAVQISGKGTVTGPPHRSGIDKAYDIPAFTKVPYITSLEEKTRPNKYIYVPGTVSQGGNVFVMELTDQFMAERMGLHPGEAVMVEEGVDPDRGDLVVAKVDGEVLLGNYEKYGDTVVIKNDTVGDASADRCLIEIIGAVQALFKKKYLKRSHIIQE